MVNMDVVLRLVRLRSTFRDKPLFGETDISSTGLALADC
jgi:hypothetical protein